MQKTCIPYSKEWAKPIQTYRFPAFASRHGVGAATSEQLAAVVAAAPPAFVTVSAVSIHD